MSKKKINKPMPTGEYAVGTFSFTIKNDREETMYNAIGSKRSIPVKVFYPADKESVKELPKARYMSKATIDAIRKNYFVPLKYEKVESDGTNRSECYENAPFIEGERFPLILFNHGFGSFIEAHTYLYIELASHGYIVASLGHPYEGMITELDDGTVYKLAKGMTSKAYSPLIPGTIALLQLQKAKGTNEELWERFDATQKKYNGYMIERIPEWELDTKAALTYLKEHYSGIIDFENGVGVSGHSFGGATAYALCEDEPETFTCGINMDGALFGNHDGKSITTPFLQMNCEKDKTAVTVAFIENKNVAYHAVLKDMEHLGFSDMKYAIPLKSQVGKSDPDITHNTMCGIHLEFFDTYLKKVKDKPIFESNEFVSFKEYQP